jgi:diguanylate cyclase (GGDEF)-like protein
MAYRGNREYWDALEKEYLLEKKSKDVEKMSRVDGLTGLYNRRYFDEAFAFEWNRAIRNQTPLSLIICDIDHFKRVNDQYGHLAGDEYLKAMAIIIRRLFKRNIDITARFGGEEFIILLGDQSSQHVCKLAETLRNMTQEFCLEYQEKTIRTTLSLGVSTYIPQQNDGQDTLIFKADKALYQSKACGRNRVTQNN